MIKIINENLSQIFYATFLLCFVLGNFAINLLSIILILYFCIIKYDLKILNNLLNYLRIDLLIILFSFIIINCFLSTNIQLSFYKLISILKNFLFFFTLFLLFEKNLDKNFLEKISYISLYVISFICFDLIFQFNFGFNFFGMTQTDTSGVRFSGVFGDEWVVGSFLNYFFLLPLISLKKKPVLMVLYFMIIFFALFISGEKKATIMTIFIALIFLILNFKNFNKKIRVSIILLFFLPIAFVSMNKNFNERYISGDGSLLRELGVNINVLGFNKDRSFGGFTNTPHVKHFGSAMLIWKRNIFFGSGIGTFRYECSNEENINKLKNFYCSTHPHNYYFEILSDMGIIFFILLVFCLCLFFKNLFFQSNSTKKNNYLNTIFLLLFFNFFFPFQTTGSLFASKNLIYLAFIFSIYFRYKKSN